MPHIHIPFFFFFILSRVKLLLLDKTVLFVKKNREEKKTITNGYFDNAAKSIKNFNLNTKVIYRAPIPPEKRQRAEPIL
ncbi:hypothetical protein PUN28_006514 [Cardiocondyla obscurior]|uniref:Uncharacterized protein n=1 Tax=Cardiocondyla obscurior TaxID=286306 RepID=A0AAW2GE84_9HYME